jgi:hypothetical protein
MAALKQPAAKKSAVTSVKDHPAVVAAQTRLSDLQARHAAAKAELAHIEAEWSGVGSRADLVDLPVEKLDEHTRTLAARRLQAKLRVDVIGGGVEELKRAGYL